MFQGGRRPSRSSTSAETRPEHRDLSGSQGQPSGVRRVWAREARWHAWYPHCPGAWLGTGRYTQRAVGRGTGLGRRLGASQAPGDALGAGHQSVSRGKGRGRSQRTRGPERGVATSLVHSVSPPSFISQREEGPQALGRGEHPSLRSGAAFSSVAPMIRSIERFWHTQVPETFSVLTPFVCILTPACGSPQLDVSPLRPSSPRPWSSPPQNTVVLRTARPPNSSQRGLYEA